MNRNNNITLIHITAAIMVICGHEFALLNMIPLSVLGIGFHVLGVHILFYVAGFLTAGSYERSKNIGEYLFKRFCRLYPPLILCLFVTALFLRITTNSEDYFNSAFQWMFDNARFYMNYGIEGVFQTNTNSAVNGSLWTLPIEIVCYFITIPFMEIMTFLMKRSRKLGIIVIIAFIMCIALIVNNSYLTSNKTFIFYGTDWIQGMTHLLLFLIGESIYILRIETKFFSLQVSALLVCAYMLLQASIKVYVWPFLLAYMIMSFAFPSKPLFSNLIRRDICYGLYLWAFPVQQFVIWMSSKNRIITNFYAYLLVSIVITWVLANIQYELIEKNISKILNGVRHE